MSPIKHSISVNGRRTSVCLEAPFWDEVKRIAKDAGQTLRDFAASVEAQKNGGTLSSALRLAVLADLKAQIGERSNG